MSRTNSWSKGDSRNPQPWAQKTQIFKVLRFELNFRGRLFMTIMGMIWPYLLLKKPTSLFIHDSS